MAWLGCGCGCGSSKLVFLSFRFEEKNSFLCVRYRAIRIESDVDFEYTPLPLPAGCSRSILFLHRSIPQSEREKGSRLRFHERRVLSRLLGVARERERGFGHCRKIQKNPEILINTSRTLLASRRARWIVSHDGTAMSSRSPQRIDGYVVSCRFTGKGRWRESVGLTRRPKLTFVPSWSVLPIVCRCRIVQAGNGRRTETT